MSKCASMVAALTIIGAAPNLLLAQERVAARPNIVFILSDDHRWDALGVAGNSGIIRAETNDNRLAAGSLQNGVLSISLVAQQTVWYPEAEEGPSKVVEAFGEVGKAPRVPPPDPHTVRHDDRRHRHERAPRHARRARASGPPRLAPHRA